jgi:hypothetical protein
VKKIMGTLREQHECSLEDLIEICGAGISNQVFLEVDRMTQAGEIRLLYTQGGGVALTLP